MYLQVIMTYMRAERCSKFRQIRLLTAELAALERLKKMVCASPGRKPQRLVFSQCAHYTPHIGNLHEEV